MFHAFWGPRPSSLGLLTSSLSPRRGDGPLLKTQVSGVAHLLLREDQPVQLGVGQVAQVTSRHPAAGPQLAKRWRVPSPLLELRSAFDFGEMPLTKAERLRKEVNRTETEAVRLAVNRWTWLDTAPGEYSDRSGAR